MEGKLCNQIISVLIDTGSNYSDTNLELVEKCQLVKESHIESWLVQLATMKKRKINH